MLAFDADKNLYISIGDGGNADDATGEVLKIVAAPAAGCCVAARLDVCCGVGPASARELNGEG